MSRVPPEGIPFDRLNAVLRATDELEVATVSEVHEVAQRDESELTPELTHDTLRGLVQTGFLRTMERNGQLVYHREIGEQWGFVVY